MSESFISVKDRIISASIEIISEAGLNSLSTNAIAMRINTNEAMIYKCFGGIDEVLIEVIEYFAKFDKGIMATVAAKQGNTVEKILWFFETYATYYESYPEITAIVLNYEGLLHNTDTRETITACIVERGLFLTELIQNAIDSGELTSFYSAQELSLMLIGIFERYLLDRRVEYHQSGFKQEIMQTMTKLLKSLALQESIGG